MMTTIRNPNPELFQRFKAEAKRRGQTIGEAFEDAMWYYLAINRKHLARLSDLPSSNWGPSTESTSKEIDDIIAGLK